MDLTEYESLSWEKQFEYLKQVKGFTNISPTNQRIKTEWKTATKDEALSAWKEEVKKNRAEMFKKNILKPREKLVDMYVSKSGVPLIPPQSGIISEPMSSEVLSSEPVVKNGKSLQQLESEVDSIVREVLSRYG